MVTKYYVNISGEYTGDAKELIVDANNLGLTKIKLIITEVKDSDKLGDISDVINDDGIDNDDKVIKVYDILQE